MRRLIGICMALMRILMAAEPAATTTTTQPAVPAKKVAVRRPRPAPAKEPDAVISLVAPAKVEPAPLIPEPPKVPMLDPITAEAIRVAQEWRNMPMVPTAGPAGTVQYIYGRGYPMLVCAPLHVCWLELQTGEKLKVNEDTGKPMVLLGDSSRWDVITTEYSPDDEASSAVIFKPLRPNVETNGIIVTDRRRYFFGLKSTEHDYVNGISFAYPDDDRKRIRLAKEAAAREAAELAPVIAIPTDHKYKVKGGDATLKPTRVFDDGHKVYIRMPAAMDAHEAPALTILDESNHPQIVNYRVVDDLYIVDRLFRKGQLKIGNGSKFQVVEITRQGA